MGYLLVEDFAGGVDLRKSTVAAKQGTLRQLTNGFINVGGEIEKRKAVTNVGLLPAGDTHGLSFRDSELVVFGTKASGDVGALPSYTDYIRLLPTAGTPTIERIMDVSPYGDELYVIALMSDGIRHFETSGATAAEVAQTGNNARTHRTKTYITDGKNLRFSATLDMSDFAGTGSGLIDVRTQDTAMGDLIGLEQYYSYLACFAGNAVQLWAMDPDPAQNALIQTLGNIGLAAPHAASQYGNGDVLFLSHSGVRSLRARDSSNAAVLNDLGSPIDPLITGKRAVLTATDAEKIKALVDPLSGHWWLVWGNEIHVYAYYPNSKVSAWSTFRLNVATDYVVVANSRVAFRSGEYLYIYGSVPASGSPFDPSSPVGTTAALYDATVVDAILPAIDMGKPATEKKWAGLDLACEGTWIVEASPSVKNPNAWVTLATVTNNTFEDERIGFDWTSTHLNVRLRSVGTGLAKVSQLAVHSVGDGDAD